MSEQVQNDMFAAPCDARSAVSCAVHIGMVCTCELLQGHEGPHKCLRCGMLYETRPPGPPTGPEAEVPSREDGRYPAYVGWLDTDEGRAFWHALKIAAWAAYEDGELRFSTRTYVARYRDDNRVKINDHYTAWLADDLVAACPELLDIIERRVRKKGKG